MRNFDDWLTAYVKFADVTEAPTHMHLWAGLSIIAGALERKVWLDMQRYRWYPNLYTLLVGPPEEIKKSSTVGPAISLLKKIPNIKFGPKTVTWEGLIKFFQDSQKDVEIAGDVEVHSPLYIYAAELGVFFDPSNAAFGQQMIDMYDGEEIDKSTKTSGSEYVEKPLLNLISCTTPEWIMGNMLPSMVGDGLFSRIIFLYADRGVRDIAWVDEHLSGEDRYVKQKLLDDLETISKLTGAAYLTPEARNFGREWYSEMRAKVRSGESKVLQRRQTQVVKVCMALAASKNSVTETGRLKITESIFRQSVEILDATDGQREKVVEILMKAKSPHHVDNILAYLKPEEVIGLQEFYLRVMNAVPRFEDFRQMVVSAREAGLLVVTTKEVNGKRDVTVSRAEPGAEK
jgi:hypothetical protein